MNKKNGLSRYRRLKLVEAFCADLTATQTAQILNLNRNTVNRYYRLFREAIRDHQHNLQAQFSGVVEADESYFGAVRPRGRIGPKRHGRGTNKQPVFGVIERGGRVFTEIVPDVKKKTLQDLIRGKVALDATIITDGWRAYSGLVDVGYDRHLRIKKYRKEGNPFTDGDVHINGIESFWSFTKRRLAKFNGTVNNFELHLKESEWRWGKDHATLKRELWTLLV
ncbi:MAG: IS1595 family transposase [Pseudomonadota bacterium]